MILQNKARGQVPVGRKNGTTSRVSIRRLSVEKRFNQFFDLSPKEKSQALSSLSDAERRQIERTLQAFSNLPSAQRSECIRSLNKFASLSIEDRQQFLKNVERWKLMTPDERNAWRELVTKLSLAPPLPPGFNTPVRPPMPPAVSRRLATNGG